MTINVTLWNSTWEKDILSLVSSSPLEYLQLYGATVINDKTTKVDDFVTNLTTIHGSRLKRFSLHRLPISLKALDDVCTGFTNLQQLFIAIEQRDLVSPLPSRGSVTMYINEFQEFIRNSLSKATKLQAVHINFLTLCVEGSYVSTEDALQIVNQCSPTLTQIGCASCVWQVSRAPNIPFGESYTRLGCKGGHTGGRGQDDNRRTGTVRSARGP